MVLMLAWCGLFLLRPNGALVWGQSSASHPNIVVFLVDDLGVMDTSVPFLADTHGQPERHELNRFYRTPNLERLAAQGMRFGTFYGMSVCSPTRVSLMTGQNSARHRTTNWIDPDQNNAGPHGPPDWNWQGLGPNDLTLARLLRSAGYRTIHVGKGHFGPRNSPGEDPRNLGFDVNIGGASIGQPASYYGSENYGHRGGRVVKTDSHAVPNLEKYHGTETFLTDALTLEAQSEVTRAVESGVPFFLYLSHYAVHGPFQSDPRFAEHYTDSAKPRPAQAYATLVEGVDRSLGAMLDHLEKLRVSDQTLIVFLGDNGGDAPLGGPHEVACAAPLRGKKGSHYEGGMRTPLVVAWAEPQPDQSLQQRFPVVPGGVQRHLTVVYDLFPTILDAAGITAPSDHRLDGRSLQDLLAGETRPDDAASFLMHYPHAPHRTDYFTVYREGPWKVIYHYFPTAVSGHSHYQLYRLDDDPYEQNDLAGEEPDELRRLMQAMVARLTEQKALMPIGQAGERELPQIP
ncbi:MAG: sulfatase [Pirellulales bacterium]